MTKKERMKKAMSGGIPDRVPFNPQICFPHAVRNLEKDYTNALVKGVENPLYNLEALFEMTKFYDSDAFRIMSIGDVSLKVKLEGTDYIAYDKKSGQRLGVVDLLTGNIIYDIPPLQNKEDVENLRIQSKEEYLESREFEVIKQAIKWSGKDFFLIAPILMVMDNIFNSRGMDHAVFDMMDDPGFVRELNENCLLNSINRAKAFIECGVDAIYLGDAASSCSLISPSLFKEYSLPYFKRFVEEIKPMGVLIYIHICGNVRPIIDMMLEIGADCIEPMDPLGGMTPKEFRETAGKKVSLMGGVNTVTLANGSVYDVEKEALQCIKDAGSEGAYILAAGDMVPFEAPKENVLKMSEAAKSYYY